MRVLVSDPLSEVGLKIMRDEAGIEVVTKTKLSEDELVEEIKGYSALIVRSGTTVTRRIIEAGRDLKVIGRAGVGVDNIDVKAATENGILVVNAPEGNTVSTAEHTIALMMAMVRRVPQAHSSLKGGKWDRKSYVGSEIYGKTLGVIGLGRVGREVARKAMGLGMEVMGYDPFIPEETAKSLGITLSDVDAICSTVDVLTVHTPLNEKTRSMVNSERIESMKSGAYVINCARGGIVDEDALYSALESGKLAGAALDVYNNEPPLESPLLKLDNVVLTPHLGASTAEAQENVALDVARQVIRILKGQSFKNAVNLPAISPEAYKALQPYMDLAQRLGAFVGGVVKGFDTIDISYSGGLGEMERTELQLLTSHILKGALSAYVDSPVSIVNAADVAEARGIKRSESQTRTAGPYPSEIRIKAASGTRVHSVVGVVLEGSEMRISELDGFRMDFSPSGDILFARHTDQPGVIGEVGQILGREGVNIASMYVGRREQGGDAVMLLSIDGTPSESSLKAVQSAKGIRDVEYVSIGEV